METENTQRYQKEVENSITAPLCVYIWTHGVNEINRVTCIKIDGKSILSVCLYTDNEVFQLRIPVKFFDDPNSLKLAAITAGESGTLDLQKLIEPHLGTLKMCRLPQGSDGVTDDDMSLFLNRLHLILKKARLPETYIKLRIVKDIGAETHSLIAILLKEGVAQQELVLYSIANLKSFIEECGVERDISKLGDSLKLHIGTLLALMPEELLRENKSQEASKTYVIKEGSENVLREVRRGTLK